MADNQLQADTAYVVHLRSYSFFHSGRERLQNRVLKRVWEHIPGGTLYGAVAAALIRLDGIDEQADPFEEGAGDYHALLKAVKERRIRFTPLLPASEELRTAADYCDQAQRLERALYGEELPAGMAPKDEPLEPSALQLFHTTPHAPLDRSLEQIHGDQLFVLRTHRPLLDYYGFVFGDRAVGALLRRALRLFPCMPLGGRGKFSLVEGEVVQEERIEAFRDSIAEKPTWIRLLTPMVLRDGQEAELLMGAGRKIVTPGLKRYRVWRTGRYYNAQEGAFDPPMGVVRRAEERQDAFLAGGAESASVLAVPERSRFSVLPQETKEDVAAWFIEGAGNPSWTYLGWGQVVIL